jgi:hypothetical protein
LLIERPPLCVRDIKPDKRIRRTFLRRAPTRRTSFYAVRLEIDGDAIDLSAASTAEQERLIDIFITRHGAGKDDAWAANVKP